MNQENLSGQSTENPSQDGATSVLHVDPSTASTDEPAEKPKFVRRTGAARPNALITKKANPIVQDANLAQTPSSMAAYDEEWSRLFATTLGAMKTCRVPLEQLKMNALSGTMRNSRFRSVIWRVLLGVLSTDSSLWESELKEWRLKYELLKKDFIVDPHVDQNESNLCPDNNSSSNEGDCNNNKTEPDDPLSQDHSSTWNRYFCGKETKREITQDVVRTFPEVEFFRDESIRDNLINVLFCFSHISKVRYCQGMHEILAPLLFVLQYDRMTYQHFAEAPDIVSTSIREGKDLFCGDYLEHDAFSMFCKIMEIIEDWYYVKEDETQSTKKALTPSALLNVPTILSKDELVEREPFRSVNSTKATCAGVERLLKIQNVLLKQHDLELFLHLENLEISPQMYGLRWIRLMFGREYPLQDLLVIWDSIFAIQNDFVLVDYIHIAMLHLIREHLLARDFSDVLCLLMRYPQGSDVSFVIETALHLYKPKCYDKPKETGGQRVYLSAPSTNASRVKIYRSRNPSSSISSRENSFRQKKNEILAKIGQFSFSSLRRNVSTMMSSRSTQNLTNLRESSPKPVKRNVSRARAPRPMSLMIPAHQQSRSNSPNALHLPKSSVKKDSPRQGDSDFDSSWKSSLESAPVTPTQEYYNQNDFSKYRTFGGRARAVSGSVTLNSNDDIVGDSPEDSDSDSVVNKELLRLCDYCSKELTACIDQISGYVTDYANNQTDQLSKQPQQLSEPTAARFKYKTPYDDVDSLRQALIRMSHIRDLLSGADMSREEKSNHRHSSKPVFDVRGDSPPASQRSFLSKSFSTQSLAQYLPGFQWDDKESERFVELQSYNSNPN